MIKYIGSKRTLVPEIVQVISAIPGCRSVLDLFSGTSRVGHALKRAGFRVHANDHNAYAEVLARCYIQADREDVHRDATLLISELNRLPGKPGYFTETYCIKSRFFQPKNGARIDAIREEIARKGLEPELEAVLLVSLMEAADRVDSTTGVQMAYLKNWAPRSYDDLHLRMPDVLPRVAHGKCTAHKMDALEAIRYLEGDVAYIDPPYNQHKYLSNYHIWETLVLWDKPKVYGRACKRVDCRSRQSAFNSRELAKSAMKTLIENVRARYLVVSFNDEGFFTKEEIEDLLRCRGHILVLAFDYKRYVGAQIGIYNPAGQKVGSVSHLRNTEFLFVVSPAREVLEGVARRLIATRGACRSTTGVVEFNAAGQKASENRENHVLLEHLCDLLRTRGFLSFREVCRAIRTDKRSLARALDYLVRTKKVLKTIDGCEAIYHWHEGINGSDSGSRKFEGRPSTAEQQGELPLSE